MEAITKRQIKAIWVLAHRGGLNAEDLFYGGKAGKVEVPERHEASVAGYGT